MIDLTSIGWQHTIPPMILMLALIFRKPLTTKIIQLRNFTTKGKELKFLFGTEKEQNTLPEAGERIMSVEDVVTQFSQIEWFNKGEIEKLSKDIRIRLIQNDIVTKSQLVKLVESKQVQSTLASIYSKIN